MESKIKNNKGITLIALIVTIIVLIILAGISVNLLLGENGLIQRAKDAATQQERAELIEGMKLAIANKQILTHGELTQSDIEEVLGAYGTVADGKVTTTKGGHEIAITDVYNGTITPPVVTKEWRIVTDNKTMGTGLSIGDLVQPIDSTLANEKFYVIGKDDTAGTVTLLTERCVKTSSGTGQYTQMAFSDAGTLAFDSSSNVYYDGTTNPITQASICIEVNYYIAKFTDAGMHLQEVTNEEGNSTISGLYGRLMWGKVISGEYTKEIKRLYDNNLIDILYGPEGEEMNYWVGSTSSTNYAYLVNGQFSDMGSRHVSVDLYFRTSSCYRSFTI